MNATLEGGSKEIVVPTQRRTAFQLVTDLAKARNIEHRSHQLVQHVEKKYLMMETEQRD
jgi:hypothetical protein